MIIRKLRLEKGWSQEQLSDFSGVSVRTIQRLERGQKASLESLKCLAAVFEIDIADLQKDEAMTHDSHTNTLQLDKEEQDAMEYVRDLKSFYSHALSYAVIIPFLFLINLFTHPGYIWAFWPAMGWGIGLIFHALEVFEIGSLFSPKWEKEQIKKRLKSLKE